MSDQNPWIPVEEMLPQPLQLVWIWTDYTFPDELVEKYRHFPTITIKTGFLDDAQRWRSQAPSWVNVTHWMPVPPPPPGHTYPKLKHGVSPAGRQPAEARA